jgi:hypothetical protein
MDQARVTYLILLATGAAFLLFSAVFVSSFLAFIGLGLVFWGVIFPYIRTEEYTKKTLFDATLHSQLELLRQTFRLLDLEGDAVYLPPKYFSDPDTIKVYAIREKEVLDFSALEMTRKQEDDSNTQLSKAMLTPPGFELAKLFEKILGTDFTKVDLEYLRDKLPKVLVESLEIAEKMEMRIEKFDVFVSLKNLKIKCLSQEVEQLPLGSILSSSIACAIAKAGGQAVRVRKQRISEPGNVLMHYSLLSEEVES